jgi:hypothetical protein
MRMKKIVIALLIPVFLTACKGREHNTGTNQIQNTMITDTIRQYGNNLSFLKKHIGVIELKKEKAAIAVVPAWQGRVMTSTSEGEAGFSFGWINRELISEGRTVQHINPFGGEERIWLGPEGGQYSIFFKKGDEFVYDNWQTPAFIDTEPFEIKALTDSSVLFSHDAEIVNYSGTSFRSRIERKITLLSGDQIIKQAGIDTRGLNSVAYRSENKLTNSGTNEWEKESGLLSIWMLGMFNPSPSVVVVIPFNQGDEKSMGVIVNDSYFGKIAADRLKVSGNKVFFRADGKSRGKIGLSQSRTTGMLGSYDFENKALTFLVCKLPEKRSEYVNSAWEIQKDPFSGDAVNSYNDGPLADGSQMGPFYELETSSPAAALKPGESITHSQITIHLTGDEKLLNQAALKSLGVSLDEIRKVFE